MDTSTINKKQIIGIAVIILFTVGIGIGVYLVRQQQTIKSRASGGAGNFVNAFEIKDQNGNIINCDASTNPPTCTTNTLDITVRVKDTAPLLP